jgi:acyl carrier protein
MSTNTLMNTPVPAQSASVDDRAGRIAEIVCEHLEVEPGEIGEEDQFVADHGADSLMLIGVLAALEKEFKVVIDQSEMPRMTSIAGVRAVVAESAGR